MKKRIFSLLLCIVMCLSLFPMSAFAADTLSYDELMSISKGGRRWINGNGVVFRITENMIFNDSFYTEWYDPSMSRTMQVSGNVYTVTFSQTNTFAFKVENNTVVEVTIGGFSDRHESYNGTYVHYDYYGGDYINNGDGTHSRKCTGCNKIGATEAHSFTDGVCACGAVEEFVISDEGVLTKYNGAGGDVVIPAKVTVIGDDVFWKNESITSVTIPNATKIGMYAFAECKNLTNVNMPNAVDIDDHAFQSCGSLTSVNAPKASSFGWETFSDCINLTTLTVSDKLNAVSSNAFANCNITTVYYPCSSLLSRIKVELNLDCTYTAIHNIPEGYVNLGDGTHAHKCTDCDEHDTPEAHSFTDGVCSVCNADEFVIANGVLTAYNGAGGNVVLPDEVTTINANVFQGNSSITSVVMPNVTQLARYTFANCENLQSVTMPKMTSVTGLAFDGDAKLTSITISDELKSLGATAFSNCGLKTVNYPCTSDVKTIKSVLNNSKYTYTPLHNFTDDYKDNGDGTHSRKCQTCNEYVAPEAHSYTNDVCVCGAEDLETVKAAATAELNAAIAAAKCGEAKEVLTQALNDLATAQTVAAVKGIAGNAKSMANQYDNDYSTRLVGYTSALDAELNKPTASESLKARIEKLKEDIANAPTISELDRLFLSNIADIQLEGLKDAAVSEINAAKTDANASIAEAAVTAIGSAQSEDEINTIKSKALADMKEADELAEAKEYTKNAIDELVPADASDELKTAAKKAKDAVDAAKTMDEIDAACDEFSKAYDFLQYKEERIASFEEALNSDEYSDAFKALVEEMMDAVKAADSKEAIDAIGEEYSPRLDLQYDKDEACAAIEELLPNDPSDAVKKIASDACDKIQASDDSTGFDSFVNETRLAIEAQLQKEAELAPAKEAAIAEITKAKTDANASVAEDAIKAINDATTVDEVNKLKEQALADMAKADAAAELDAAKKSAIDTINAYKSDVNASIADAAIAGINKATTTTEVSNIVNQAIPNLLAADRKAEFKGKITNELLPAAKCDEAKAILNKALTDLDDAVTLDEVNTVFYNAQGQAKGQDGAFTGMLAGYTNAFNSAITDVATDETKAFVSEMLKALDEATSIARINEIYNSNKDKISVCINRDKNVDDFNKYIDSDEYSDEMKAIAHEAIEKLMQAESVSNLDKITKEYKLKLDVQEDKETVREVLASDEYSDEMKELARDVLDELDSITTSEELTELWDKYNPLIDVQFKKDDAREKVKALLPEDASDAVKKIVGDACDEIQANDDPDQYADIIEASSKAVEAQLQKEKELAPVKKAAIAEINDAKTDANASVAEDAVKAINNAQSEDEITSLKEKALADMAAADAAAELAAAKEEAIVEINKAKTDANASVAEDAIKAINDATTVDEVSNLKDEALADMAEADAAAELAEAKEAAKKAIDEAVPADASDAVKAAAEEAKTAIDNAKSVEDVNAAKESGTTAIEEQIAADKEAAELAEAKEAAKKAIDDAVPADASDAVKTAAENAKVAIDEAKSVEDVNAAKESGTAAIEKQIAADSAAELAAAKEAAKAAIDDAVPADASDAVKAAADEAKTAIDEAKSVEDVNAAKESGTTAIEEQIAADKEAAELAEAKEAAKKAIDDAVPTDASDAVKAAAAEAKAAIDNAKSVEDVNAAKESGTTAIEDQIAADSAAELAAAKEAAKAAIDDAVPADASNEVKAAAEAAKNDIDAATTTDAVNTAKENGLTAIDDQIAADKLAEAKEAAKKAILAEQGDDTAENVTKASRDAIAAIDAATTVDAVNAEKAKGVEAIRTAKAANNPVSYTIITGADSTWTKGSTDVLLVRSNAPFAKFVSVKVDGAVVAASNYIAEEGSTIIKLKPAYLETLKLGKHSIEILSADGSASTYFTINAKSDPTTPQTGDNSNMFLWVALLLFSGAALTGTAVYGKKKKYRAE